jgi:peptidoglycan/LPS O-acetylase OafA/YrhL
VTREPGPDFADWTDLCRALAAMLVTVSHARDILMIDYHGPRVWLPWYALTGFGHSGVILFFVLSGFWISRSVLQRIDGAEHNAVFWAPYLIDRLARLGIVLVPALLLGGALDAVGALALHLPIYQGMTGAHSMAPNVAAQLTLPVFLGNLAFLQTIAVAPWGSNGPLWSLAYEFWYYIWFPALALLVRRRRISIGLLALVIGIAEPALYWGFASWLVGLGVLLLTMPKRLAPMRGGYVVFAGLLFAAIMLGTGAVKQSWTDLPLAIGFGLLLLALNRTATPFPSLLRPLASFGRNSSFSLYAIHFPIIALLGGWLVGKTRLLPGAYSLLLVLALTAVCMLAGWALSRGTERFTPQLRALLRRRLLGPAPLGHEA